jgi:hypothetical protein
VALCSFEGPGRLVSRLFPVALARGKHLFPFRTEQLSPSAPMVLGSQGPGRVGRRRFLLHTGRPSGAARRVAGLRPCAYAVDVGRPDSKDAARSRPPSRSIPDGLPVPWDWPDGATAGLRRGRRLAPPPRCPPPAQRPKRGATRLRRGSPVLPAVRVSPGGLVARDREFVLADLPVDWIVVLEQEERAGQRERPVGVLCELRCPS